MFKKKVYLFLAVSLLAAVLLVLPQIGVAAPPQYTLTTDVVGCGSVNPASGSYKNNEWVLMTATPCAGWSFDHWEANVYVEYPNDSVTHITMQGDALVTAFFIDGGGGPTPTPEPTNTPAPEPTNTPPVPTSTPGGPTDTPVPPTDTPVPPTATPVLPTSTPGGNPILLSQYRPAYESSIEMAGFEAEYAVDGHPVTRWASQYSDPQWMYIDLQGTADITRVVLKWEAAYGSAYEIQVSDDAITWTTIYAETRGRGGVEDLTVSGTGRYVRMYGTERATIYGYSLYEFEVYGTGGGPLIDPTATPLPTNTPTPGPSPTPGPYVLVWSDEFDGTSLDTSKWTHELGYLRNEEDQWYQEDNTSVANGVLTIEARREATGHQCGSEPCQYTSSSLYTRGKGDFLYGKIEARLKLPMAAGTWPAFWTLGSNINLVIYPACGEIDIMEHIDSETITYGGMWYGAGKQNRREKESASSIPVADPENWHVYSVEWDAQEIKWFVDGVQFHQASITESDREEFHGSQYLILNLAIGGVWPQDPSGTTFPQIYQADWVRVYQRQ